MNKKEQEQMISKLFHGDKKTQTTGNAAVLADGRGVFLDASEDVTREPGQKRVKALLNPSDKAAVFGMNLTLQVTERVVFARPDLTTGCQLLSLAQKVGRNATKAISIMEKRLGTKTGKARRSGENISSVAKHALDTMFLLLHGCRNDAGSDSEDKDDDSLVSGANAASPGSGSGSCPPG